MKAEIWGTPVAYEERGEGMPLVAIHGWTGCRLQMTERLEPVFADLPGYGYAKVAKSEKQRWAQLIEGYFNDGRNIQLVFQLVDMRHPPTADDLQMIDYLIEHEFPFVVVLTKRDKLSKKQQADRLAALQQEIPYADQITMIPFSAETGEGVEEIRSIIEEIAAQDPGEEEEPPQE